MTKSELIDDITAQTPGVLRKDIETIVNEIFDSMAESLSKRGRVEIRGFGSFSAKRRNARGARNPRSGEKVSVPQKYVPFFVIGKELRERINQITQS